MAIAIFPITPDFAAEIGEIDLSRPMAAPDLAALREAFARYAVLIFPAQTLSPDDHVRFAEHFGPLQESMRGPLGLKDHPLRVREELIDIANMDVDGRIWDKDSRNRLFHLGNRLWHIDASFREPAGYASLLYARSIAPIGGHTEFADLRAAYDALPETTKKRLAGLVAHHSFMYSRARFGVTDFTEVERKAFAPLRRPLVRTIPQNGRQTLYIAAHIGPIEGMTDNQAAELLEELTAHAAQRQFVYTHRWRVGDLVMWDNRCTMHRGTEFEDTRWLRDMHRATTSDQPDAFGAIQPAAVAAAVR
jgi:alpha-ketoglutarate-dependent 2,4-dichlorophenoxyacetate dioxygenase